MSVSSWTAPCTYPYYVLVLRRFVRYLCPTKPTEGARFLVVDTAIGQAAYALCTPVRGFLSRALTHRNLTVVPSCIPTPIASVEVLRCLRCARSVEATSTDDSSSTGMVRIAHNLYYCERCAKMVGYK
ncbi:hypothetical protein Cob_v005577 [Colletotrichum orbiculare MAFF 240422]|uniref:Uncharacterized protein n=1 Tax=Colletotrichum orbiculare (strain 104-T / ATCC 96160 / CBS 514.97 / LARS 414 / MAFF 240422) TaxID=1213857 RepID=A0A484FUT0_COLOR|nr:hypothetical protein Cob_v005577 [Colletotrichum orbiculare MAFF 240422]